MKLFHNLDNEPFLGHFGVLVSQHSLSLHIVSPSACLHFNLFSSLKPPLVSLTGWVCTSHDLYLVQKVKLR